MAADSPGGVATNNWPAFTILAANQLHSPYQSPSKTSVERLMSVDQALPSAKKPIFSRPIGFRLAANSRIRIGPPLGLFLAAHTYHHADADALQAKRPNTRPGFMFFSSLLPLRTSLWLLMSSSPHQQGQKWSKKGSPGNPSVMPPMSPSPGPTALPHQNQNTHH